MRLLGCGHLVSFYASSEVHNMLTRQRSSYTPNCVDVIEWTIENSLAQIKNDFYYWAIQGLSYMRKQCSNVDLTFQKAYDFENFFKNCKEKFSNKLSEMYGNDRHESLVSEIIKNKIQKHPPHFNLRLFAKETNKLVLKMEGLVPSFKKLSQVLEEEFEMEIEKEQEEECELERPAKAEPRKNKLDHDVELFVKMGIFNEFSSSFLTLGQSFANSSLSEFEAENQAWSKNIFVTRDFFETVKTSNLNDDYLASPRWIGVINEANPKAKTPIIALILSGFEVNDLMHYFNKTCQLVMMMPRMRHGQRLLFSMMGDNVLPDESIRQELSLFSGSLFFNTFSEQECFLEMIGFFLDSMDIDNDTNENNNYIERNGFVYPKNRSLVFGNERSIRTMFDRDPTKFIIQLALMRNYALVPKSAHHLAILLKSQKPLKFE